MPMPAGPGATGGRATVTPPPPALPSRPAWSRPPPTYARLAAIRSSAETDLPDERGAALGAGSAVAWHFPWSTDRMTVANDLIEKAERREALFGIIGLGYVGLPLAIELARAGFPVLGYDVSQRVVDGLNAGRSHIKDVPDAALQDAIAAGRFEATTEASRLAEPDAISICVPTPLSKYKDPDVSYIVAATEAVRATLRRGQAVILESTTYPGTTREIMLPALESTGLKVGEDFF